MLKSKIGLFFGSFNPVHNGHLMIANYLVEYTDLEAVWFIISPQNPFKQKMSLLKDHHRMEILEKSIADDPRFEICDIEFFMPKPSYTIDTLVRLSERHPNFDFYLICGMDNLQGFKKWKNSDMILQNYHLLVYPRKGFDGGDLIYHPSVQVVDAPIIEVSSTFIRDAIAHGKDIRYFMPTTAYQYVRDMHFYEERE